MIIVFPAIAYAVFKSEKLQSKTITENDQGGQHDRNVRPPNKVVNIAGMSEGYSPPYGQYHRNDTATSCPKGWSASQES
jgi:hypothetical protein